MSESKELCELVKEGMEIFPEFQPEDAERIAAVTESQYCFPHSVIEYKERWVIVGPSKEIMSVSEWKGVYLYRASKVKRDDVQFFEIIRRIDDGKQNFFESFGNFFNFSARGYVSREYTLEDLQSTSGLSKANLQKLFERGDIEYKTNEDGETGGIILGVGSKIVINTAIALGIGDKGEVVALEKLPIEDIIDAYNPSNYNQDDSWGKHYNPHHN